MKRGRLPDVPLDNATPDDEVPRCDVAFSDDDLTTVVRCRLPSGHRGEHRATVDEAPLVCGDFFSHANGCVLPAGHAGGHQSPLPDRCMRVARHYVTGLVHLAVRGQRDDVTGASYVEATFEVRDREGCPAQALLREAFVARRSVVLLVTVNDTKLTLNAIVTQLQQTTFVDMTSTTFTVRSHGEVMTGH